MFLNEITIAGHHAAKVLRPGAVLRRVDDHVVNLLCAQPLRLGREGEKGVNLSFSKQAG
jgi:hypothetical protein